MKLVLVKYCTDECTYGYDVYYCFEYESKDKFVFDTLEKAKDFKPEYLHTEMTIWESEEKNSLFK